MVILRKCWHNLCDSTSLFRFIQKPSFCERRHGVLSAKSVHYYTILHRRNFVSNTFHAYLMNLVFDQLMLYMNLFLYVSFKKSAESAINFIIFVCAIRSLI